MNKKLLVVLAALIALFLMLWIVKLKQPITGQEMSVTEEIPWWEVVREGEAPVANSEWVLDPEIPSNYVPVIGQEELYMVLDDEGNIQKYRHRTKEADTWIWADTDPHIPDNYVPVEGLDNVYKVTNVDGTERYYRYTRNKDDSYFFTEVDENNNEIKPDALTNDEIPKNYAHVSDNIYAVYNEYGVLTGYKERYVDEDGNYQWKAASEPKTQSQYGLSSVTTPTYSVGGNAVQQAGGTEGDIYVSNGGDFFQDSTYQEKESTTETKIEGDWKVVYQTTIIRFYDSSGKLMQTKTEGPTEVNRYPVTGFNVDETKLG